MYLFTDTVFPKCLGFRGCKHSGYQCLSAFGWLAGGTFLFQVQHFCFFDGVITGYIYISWEKWVVNDGIFSWDMVEARNMVIFVWGYHRISRAIMGYSWD
jgi:hypothetical protein